MSFHPGDAVDAAERAAEAPELDDTDPVDFAKERNEEVEQEELLEEAEKALEVEEELEEAEEALEAREELEPAEKAPALPQEEGEEEEEEGGQESGESEALKTAHASRAHLEGEAGRKDEQPGHAGTGLEKPESDARSRLHRLSLSVVSLSRENEVTASMLGMTFGKLRQPLEHKSSTFLLGVSSQRAGVGSLLR